MQKLILAGLILMSTGGAWADSAELAQALQNVRTNCSGISEAMAKMKTMAGINTAVTGVGALTGGVALGAGIAKAKTDKEYEELLQLVLEKSIAGLSGDYDDATELHAAAVTAGNITETEKENIQSQLDELWNKSKKLGNVRTGTLAASTVTNIAGAAIAGTNKIDEDFAAKIGACAGSVKALTNAKMVAAVEGSASPEQVTKADKIISACGQWDTVDLTSINKRATGAAVSSGIGAGLGLAGTVTSAMANTDKTRLDDTDAGKLKEKNLNTAANVLAGGTAAASLTSTIFNATQIAAIKRAAVVADECEGAL